MALATSFAPIPKAIKKPAKAAINNIIVGSKNKFSIIFFKIKLREQFNYRNVTKVLLNNYIFVIYLRSF